MARTKTESVANAGHWTDKNGSVATWSLIGLTYMPINQCVSEQFLNGTSAQYRLFSAA